MSYQHLTRRQRYIIEDLRELGKNLAFIAKELGVNRSTICREIKRNSNSRGGYKAKGAQSSAESRRPRIMEYPRKICGPLEELVIQKLQAGWSPEQISGRLKYEGKTSVSSEGIYRYVLMDRKSGGHLYKLLRRHGRKQRRGYRRSRYWIKIERRRFIDDRMQEANARTELGHWERDLLHGNRNGPAVLTIVDRKSRFTLLEKVANRTHQESQKQTLQAFKRTGMICKSLTNDNGPEFGAFHELEQNLGANVYFTHPYCSWERGTNENTNGLLRQYLPKKCSYRSLKDHHLRDLEQRLNQRPRKTLNYQTPEEIHFAKRTKLIKGKRGYLDDKLKRFIEELRLLDVALAL